VPRHGETKTLFDGSVWVPTGAPASSSSRVESLLSPTLSVPATGHHCERLRQVLSTHFEFLPVASWYVRSSFACGNGLVLVH
jgi:hypothetical protein